LPSFCRTTTVRGLADLVGGKVSGQDDKKIAGIASLSTAGPGDLSFCLGPRYSEQLADTLAVAVLIGHRDANLVRGEQTPIAVDDTRNAVETVLQEFFPPKPPAWAIGRDVEIGESASWSGRIVIGKGCSLGRNARLGDDVGLGRYVVVGENVTIGDRCLIEDGVVIHSGVAIGDRVRIKAGARLGTAGFGFQLDGEKHRRIPHPGGCVIENDVEIGANSTVDSGSVGPTVIGCGTKIDNLVQIAHNVTIGADCILLAQAGLGGSTVVENGVIIAGQAGLSGHLRIGTGARIAAQSGVIGDVPPGATVSGYPARRHRDVLRQVVALQRITARLDELEALLPANES
jgi:UDP-3-O-[3-hydroxymyristoyl] glucosamine N-acyltransferase